MKPRRKFDTDEERKAARKEAVSRYAKSEKGRAAQAKFQSSEKGRSVARKFRNSDKGREAVLGRHVTCHYCKDVTIPYLQAIVSGHWHRKTWSCPECAEAAREARGYYNPGYCY